MRIAEVFWITALLFRVQFGLENIATQNGIHSIITTIEMLIPAIANERPPICPAFFLMSLSPLIPSANPTMAPIPTVNKPTKLKIRLALANPYVLTLNSGSA